MEFRKSTLIEIGSKASQDGQSIPYTPVAFGKFGDIADYIGQGNASNAFMPEGDCIHQEMFDYGFRTPNCGLPDAILPPLFCIIFKERAVRSRKIHNVPRRQGLPPIRLPLFNTFHDCCNLPYLLIFGRIHAALFVLLSEPVHTIVDTRGRVHMDTLLLAVSSDRDHAAIPILLVGFLGESLLKYAVIRFLRHIRYGCDIVFRHIVCLLSSLPFRQDYYRGILCLPGKKLSGLSF